MTKELLPRLNKTKVIWQLNKILDSVLRKNNFIKDIIQSVDRIGRWIVVQ